MAPLPVLPLDPIKYFDSHLLTGVENSCVHKLFLPRDTQLGNSTSHFVLVPFERDAKPDHLAMLVHGNRIGAGKMGTGVVAKLTNADTLEFAYCVSIVYTA